MLTANRTAPTTLALALAAVLALLLAPAAAVAQTRDVQPYYIVVTADDTLLRAGDLRSYYPIATIQPGSVLRVTGEGERWLRVEYPRGLHALVRADHATLDPTSGMVTLSRSGALKALSDTRYGVDGSFRDVQGPDTPATTRLKHHRTETSTRGVVFYVVDAPRSAAGFIETAQARRATPSEVQAYRATLTQEERDAERAAPAESKPQTQPQPDRQAAPQAQPIGQPEQPTGEQGQPENDRSVMEPMRIERSATPPARVDGDRQPQAQPTTPAEQPGTRPTTQSPTQSTAQPTTEPDALDPLPSLEALSAAFDAVRRQGTLEAEVDELEAAFQRVLASTPDIEENASTRAWLQQRLTLLEIRKDLQESLQKVAEAKARLEAGNEQSAEAMAQLQAGRIYDFVGKLEKSAVYNGNRLPLMYRLVSVGEGIPRTLGYIEPQEGLDLERKLGVLVGVTGAATQRADLRLSTIGASNVVVLRSEENQNVRYATEPQN